jgi:hypothetical protein
MNSQNLTLEKEKKMMMEVEHNKHIQITRTIEPPKDGLLPIEIIQVITNQPYTRKSAKNRQ